ncbi:hypothetical protein WN944_022587 [Citrus x changshan-huyou]|uniref:non-specific serine/threonine protein kinase n=1 Tax=Citrus x changshan-huyou TaxID=2935761 RepID=A0AAP0N4Q8_9ROSI
MERCPIFISIIASVSLIFLILSFTITTNRTIFLALSATLAGLAALGLTIFCFRRNTTNKGEDLMKFDLGMNLKVDVELTEGNNKCKKGCEKEVDQFPLFSFSSVSSATGNFSAANKLGEGGFGTVYKGVIGHGEIAVKRLLGKSGQEIKELKNEASVIAQVQHKNLVKLLGCCIEKDERLLIYEYMPNKSLDCFLFDPTKREILDWRTRVRIIEGVAQGLLYLHQYSRVRIIHRDLKASNILLDKDMNPKISDFGMARIVFGGNDEDELQGNTSRISGTYGYMSPEYALEGIFSIKSDVFSFGVLLLEIVSGKKNTGFYRTKSLNLIGYAWDLWTSNKIMDLIDSVLEEASPNHSLARYVHIALLCVQERAEDRPTMSDVVSMLTNETSSLLPPKQPAFCNLRNMESSTSTTEKSWADCSINEVTVSILDAR